MHYVVVEIEVFNYKLRLVASDEGKLYIGDAHH